jgi:hypothetical protein
MRAHFDGIGVMRSITSGTCSDRTPRPAQRHECGQDRFLRGPALALCLLPEMDSNHLLRRQLWSHGGSRQAPVVSTIRKRALPESILLYACAACSSGNVSIIGRTLLSTLKRSVSSESWEVPEACPVIV